MLLLNAHLFWFTVTAANACWVGSWVPHLPSPFAGNPGGNLHATGKGSLARRPVRSSPGGQKGRQLAAFTLLPGTVPRVPDHRPCPTGRGGSTPCSSLRCSCHPVRNSPCPHIPRPAASPRADGRLRVFPQNCSAKRAPWRHPYFLNSC